MNAILQSYIEERKCSAYGTDDERIEETVSRRAYLLEKFDCNLEKLRKKFVQVEVLYCILTLSRFVK